MKKLLWAALLALPFVAVSPNRAAAHGNGFCLNLQGCWRIKICAAGSVKASCEPFCCTPCGPCGSGGGYGGGCQGPDCSGVVPGPWYQYWPYNGQNFMSAPETYPGWVYDMHFQTPAPVPYYGAPSPNPYTGQQGYGQTGQFPYGSYQPAAYYPSYWYGH